MFDEKLQQMEAELEQRRSNNGSPSNMNSFNKESMDELQQKLVEQNQLIEMLDEQVNN